MTTPIGNAIFVVESVAHMQGKEKELLPLIEAARDEYARLLTVEARLRELVPTADKASVDMKVTSSITAGGHYILIETPDQYVSVRTTDGTAEQVKAEAREIERRAKRLMERAEIIRAAADFLVQESEGETK